MFHKLTHQLAINNKPIQLHQWVILNRILPHQLAILNNNRTLPHQWVIQMYPTAPGYYDYPQRRPYYVPPSRQGPQIAMAIGSDGIEPEIIMPMGGGGFGQGPMMAMEMDEDGIHPEFLMPLWKYD